jgi:hypothetical protein
MKNLDQNTNYRAEFGLVFRSSAVFAVFPEARLTLSLMNYWKIKNSLDVSIVATCRSREGTFLSRHLLAFDGEIINFEPPMREGSVEIEAFGNRNLRIPYAAIMGLYETAHSVSMVHSYARNPSPAELEEGSAILSAREACMGLRADRTIDTSAYFHNGSVPVKPQRGRLIITNADGAEFVHDFDIGAIAPFETVVFNISELVPHFREWLGDADGWCAFHFENLSAFPRMLIRWLDSESGELQVTHSNFDYSEYHTNLLSAEATGVMHAPAFERDAVETEVVVYPRCTPGAYSIRSDGQEIETAGGIVLATDPSEGAALTVARDDGPMPSRLVTAIRGRAPAQQVAFECSLGVLHAERPPKRFHWAVVSARLDAAVVIEEYSELYGDPGELEITFRLFGSGADRESTRTMTFGDLSQVPRRLEIGDLFPDAEAILGEDPGYVTMFCAWGGFFMFTSMKHRETMTLEHSF